MRVFSILDYEDIDIIYEKMEEELNLLKKEGIKVDIELSKTGNMDALHCKLNENTEYKNNPLDIINIFNYYVANVIADYIINIKEDKIMEKIIRNQYYFYTPKERESILNSSMKILKEKEGFYLSNSIYEISKKVKIIEDIAKYMEDNDELIINGFIRFRLKHYIADLEDAIDAGVEDYLMEKEYNEFIRLLQYFVDIQEPKIQSMHIVIDEEYNYALLNESYQPIQNNYLEELAAEFLDGEIKYEDLLISSLITIAPTKIYIHHENPDDEDNQEILETIKKVFDDRVDICTGCELCGETIMLKKE